MAMSLTAFPAGTVVIGSPGIGLGGSTTKSRALLVEAPTVTVTGPLVAVIGTLVTSDVVVGCETGASLPLKMTTFCTAMGLKPSPSRTTGVPTEAAGGLMALRDTGGTVSVVKMDRAGATVACPSRSSAPAATWRVQRALNGRA